MTRTFSSGAALLARATTRADRGVILLSALAILLLGGMVQGSPGGQVRVFRDNRPLELLPLDRTGTATVQGRLGPVRVEVEPGRARLREYDSPRMIGTRTGWIGRTGQVAACLPCGVFIQVEGATTGPTGNSVMPEVDAITR